MTTTRSPSEKLYTVKVSRVVYVLARDLHSARVEASFAVSEKAFDEWRYAAEDLTEMPPYEALGEFPYGIHADKTVRQLIADGHAPHIKDPP